MGRLRFILHKEQALTNAASNEDFVENEMKEEEEEVVVGGGEELLSDEMLEVLLEISEVWFVLVLED